MLNSIDVERKEYIESLIVECCESSAIFYDGNVPAVKYLCSQGKIVFIEKSRKLDLVEVDIKDYNEEIDDAIIREIMERSDFLKGCESDSFMNSHYCYSFMLKK